MSKLAKQTYRLAKIEKAYEGCKNGIKNDKECANAYVWSFFRTVEKVLETALTDGCSKDV